MSGNPSDSVDRFWRCGPCGVIGPDASRARRGAGAGAVAPGKIDPKDREVGRADAGKATGLSECCGSDSIEVLTGLGAQSRNVSVVQSLGNGHGLQASKARDLPLLTFDVTAILRVHEELP